MTEAPHHYAWVLHKENECNIARDGKFFASTENRENAKMIVLAMKRFDLQPSTTTSAGEVLEELKVKIEKGMRIQQQSANPYNTLVTNTRYFACASALDWVLSRLEELRQQQAEREQG